MWCIVNLPNGTQQAVKWDPKAIGQECLEKVCRALGIICEMEYFGLEHWTPNQEESRTRQWINLRNRLSCDSSISSGIQQLMLALRVKFWVPVHFILQESVRNLFYMQAKVDLLERRLNARDWTNAAKMSALLCQAEGIRFNELSLKSMCPIRMRKERELLNNQKQAQLQQTKERKDKDYGLSFKKRRLSKQKSVENIDNSSNSNTATHYASNSNSNTTSTNQTFANSLYLKSSSSSVNTTSTNSTAQNSCAALVECSTMSPLHIYEDYMVLPANTLSTDLPDDFLREIAVEHGKLSMLKMTPKSAKYWLLQEIQDLPGYGEEIFTGFTTNENSTRCDIAVGAHGITVSIGEEKNVIPFSAIAAAKSFRRTFKLEYVNDHNDRKDIEIKLAKQAIAAGLYRSITERHAFYVCDKVRGVVTNQFTRDLKGTIASMFKEDTELGKRYVFDIQHTCREVHDQARRILHERGIATSSNYDEMMQYLSKSATLGLVAAAGSNCIASSVDDNGSGNSSDVDVGVASCSGLSLLATCSMAGKLDLVIREKEEREAAIEHCVETRISEAMTCKICMDRTINTMFNPCCHVISCTQCAARCTNCPNCRVKITSASKIYLPPELRKSQSSSSSTNVSTEQHVNTSTSIINALLNSNTTQNSITVPKTIADT